MNQAPHDPNVKSITLTGGAAQPDAPKRRRRTARQKGGSAPSDSETLVSKVNIIQQLAAKVPPTAPSLITAATAAVTPQQPGSQQGGAKANVKLVPAKNKNKTRVLLAPKAATPSAPVQSGGKTRKQKKFSLRVSNIRRKVASTRKHIHASTSLPIEKVRKELVDAKLLNPASKAPEALIRKIYADYKITTNKA